jgi:hypothetical protein
MCSSSGARGIERLLEKKRRRGPLMASFGSSELERPSGFDLSLFDTLRGFTRDAVSGIAQDDAQYWPGDDRPWRSAAAPHDPVVDEDVIAEEARWKAAAEESDAAAVEASSGRSNGDRLLGLGIQAGALLALTFALDLWTWPTHAVT